MRKKIFSNQNKKKLFVPLPLNSTLLFQLSLSPFPKKMMLSCRVKGNFIPLAALWLEKYYEIKSKKKMSTQSSLTLNLLLKLLNVLV
jgi:hypothetical protein